MTLKSMFVLILPAIPFLSWQVQAQSSSQGAFFTGEYPNVLGEWGLSDDEIQARIDETWNQLFYGDDETERVYYPVGDDMAYILDVNNNDVRSEGMSYGMMVAVQLDKQEEFDRLWKWAKSHMQQSNGYFAWHATTSGQLLSMGIAPDVMPHIFDLFTQADFAQRAQSGLGIGLAVVKETVELHGGTVQAISDGAGKGSEFAVRLPLRESNQSRPQVEEA